MQRSATFGRWVKKKADEKAEYPFEHGEVIHYTLDGVSIHPVNTKIQVFFLTCRRGKIQLRDFTMRPMVTLKQLHSLMAVIGEN